ncbi:metallophosphoesterase [Vulcanisaeta souniana]|uniref:Serine/threonine protein phosphatase n=1 Tax=Vulcanisaeta souniana JCM 11219 TaxID=1293586 RepID=A0A830EHF3_9CREN|nr:metallophosphoesterase [Vulcanisaeta souniana]BDR91612.1 serine/threonine protein phosphatase [Vulcanisaeta souniana JCM 11219]GGI71900.1 serine/threonine protein phosphatase [Vulcanisaeta souniana JCM 11219]
MLNVDILTIKEFFKEKLSNIYDAFSAYEPLLRINTDRAVIIGDLHGDVETLQRIVNKYPPDKWTYIMLGDYVDRGENQVETLYLALRLFLENRAILLRGNHESPLTNYDYGFYLELLRKLGPYDGVSIYDKLKDVFSQMPISAVLNDRYFLVHGGLPINNASIDSIAKLPKPDEIPSNETTFQLLWNDPSDNVKYYDENRARGPGTYVFGSSITENFLNESGLRMIIRGHEYVLQGFKWNHGNKVLTVFTSRAGPYSNVNPRIALINGDALDIVDAS